jgi:guanine deaminase
MENIKIFKGDIVFTATPEAFSTHKNSYLIVEKGRVKGLYDQLPEIYNSLQIEDYSNQLIMPGFVDLHVHAPQFDQAGLGYDKELIDWLNTYTFKLERQFSDLEYAKDVYTRFVNKMVAQGTTRACIYATIHKESTNLLFQLLKEKGIGAFVGKVNMDQNGAEGLQEDTFESILDTTTLIEKYLNDSMVKPIITPRFAPTCSSKLLKSLGQLAQMYGVPVQSHLSENKSEIQWVKELFPESSSYSDVYNQYGLFGQTPTLMAHGIYLEKDELDLIVKNNVMLVHCPDSNMNIASGMMPARRWLEKGIKVGLGSDVGGGHLLSMAQTMVRALQNSKLLQTVTGEKALTVTEAFYLATKSGGSFFGKVGSFEVGYEFDAIVIEDETWTKERLTLEERVQRFIYTGDDRNIVSRFVKGEEI